MAVRRNRNRSTRTDRKPAPSRWVRRGHVLAVVLSACFAGIATVLLAEVAVDETADDDATPITPKIIEFPPPERDGEPSGRRQIEIYSGDRQTPTASPLQIAIPGTRQGLILEWPRNGDTSRTADGSPAQRTADANEPDVPPQTGVDASGAAGSHGGNSTASMQPDAVIVPRHNPVARQSVVYEWPSRYPAVSPTRPGLSAPKPPARAGDIEYARKVMAEAESVALAGDIDAAIELARLARSLGAIWSPDEESPDDFLASLQPAQSEPTETRPLDTDTVVVPEAGAAFADQSADGWQPANEKPAAPSRDTAVVEIIDSDAAPGDRDRILPELQSIHRESQSISKAHRSLPEPQSVRTATISPFESVPVLETSETASQPPQEPNRRVEQQEPVENTTNSGPAHPEHLAVDATGDSIAGTPAPRRLREHGVLRHIGLEESVAPSSSEQRRTSTLIDGTATNVLTTLVAVFAVLFFGSLLVLLAIMSCTRRLLAGNGITFRVEVINSAAPAMAAAPVMNVTVPAAVTPVPAADEANTSKANTATNAEPVSEARSEESEEQTSAPIESTKLPAPTPLTTTTSPLVASDEPSIVDAASETPSESDVGETVALADRTDTEIHEAEMAAETEPEAEVELAAQPERLSPVAATQAEIVAETEQVAETDQTEQNSIDAADVSDTSRDVIPMSAQQADEPQSPILAQFINSNTQLRSDLADRQRRAG